MNGTQGTDAERPPNFREQAEQAGHALTEPHIMSRWWKGFLRAGQEGIAWWVEFILKNAGRIVVFFANSIAHGEDKADPVFRELTDAALKDLTGADARGGHRAVGKQILEGMTGGSGAVSGGQLQPSTAGAESFMEVVMKLAIEGHLEGGLLHALSLGYLEKFAELDDILADVLGIGRMSRAVMRPLLTAKVVTPMQWHTNKLYRPELLSPGDAIRQVMRGRWTREKALEELARQGFSDDRIEALFNAQRKVFSVADVRTFVERGHWTQTEGLTHLRDQGYDEAGAADALRIGGLNRFEQLEGQEASALINAYAARDIDSGTFREMLNTAVSVASERALFTELAEIRRAVNVKWLTLSQVEAMVKSGVLSVRDYRLAAEREGYPGDQVTALELQLRWELEKEKQIADLRAELEAARALEREARAAELAARKAAIERERALAKRGTENDLERAVVRGKIPIARLVEVYSARYDADTVDILVGLVEDDRLAYVAQQDAAADARQRGVRRNIDVGSLERAFMAHLLTSEEFNARLRALGYEAGDAALLTATIVARLDERTAAEHARAEAATRATKRSIDLGRYEQLVRRGARSFQQYDALLASLGFDEPARADMRDLLQLHIDDDAAARAVREAAEPALRQKGLSLEQLRRAVLLGVRSEDDFARFLMEQNFTTDAQLVLLAELRADVAEAAAARARRDRPAPDPQASGVPLSIVRRAAQLGVVTVQTYVDRLGKEGYSPEDIDLDVDLLLFEMQEAAAARARREVSAPEPPPPGPTLAELERAVKAGVATIDAYVARAITLGRTEADARLLAAVLERELETLTEARKRHEQIGFELAPRGLSLKDLDDAAKAGDVTVDEYVAQLAAWGYSADEGELLAALIALALEEAP